VSMVEILLFINVLHILIVKKNMFTKFSRVPATTSSAVQNVSHYPVITYPIPMKIHL
jgi:hypothetical protein